MTGSFRVIEPEALAENPFKMIGREWFLITAGTSEAKGQFNTMTAAWGGLGVLWQKPVTFCFVRPTRYTYQFMEANDYFTLSVFSEQYREALEICGTQSGRDSNKVARAGLTPLTIEEKAIAFEEARLIFVCKKIYFQDLEPIHFLDKQIEANYPLKDYHRMYVGEVSRTYVK